MAGPNVEISIPYLATLGDIVVNKAELEFYVADLPGDDLDIFKPNHQLVLVKKNDSDVFILIDDVVLGPTVFGGDVETIETSGGETMYKYTMNISAMLNTLIASGKADTKLYLRAFPKQETAARVVLYGPGHAQYPAKLKLTYTDINQ